MKTQIRISGQVASKMRLQHVLGRDAYKIEKFFSDINLFYESKKMAKKEMKEAYEYLCNEEPDMMDEIGGIILHNDHLSYDAAIATIL